MDAADWAALSDEQLLECRIAKLGLRLEGTALEPLIKQLYDELSAKGLIFHPPCHIGDEWFVPVGIPAIFVPFFLVHDRLRALERKMMLEVEGETPDYFMKLIRHETAHAYSYAYHLPRNKRGRRFSGKLPTKKHRILIVHVRLAAVTWCTWMIGMRRVIRTKISRRHSQFGLRPGWTGASVTLAGKRCRNSSTSTS